MNCGTSALVERKTSGVVIVPLAVLTSDLFPVRVIDVTRALSNSLIGVDWTSFLGQAQDVLAGVELGIRVVAQTTGTGRTAASLYRFLAIDPGDIKAIFLQQLVLLVIGWPVVLPSQVDLPGRVSYSRRPGNRNRSGIG